VLANRSRVLARIRTGETILAADYVDLQTLRVSYPKVNAAAKELDATLMPTTPDTAPRFPK